MMRQESPLPVPHSLPTSTVEETFRESLFHRRYELTSSLNLVYSLSQKTLTPLDPRFTSQYPRGVRGGMLCDEPGLGKTITMLAIILKSIGASSQPLRNMDPPCQSPELKGLRSPRSRRRSVSHLALLPSKTTLIITPDSLLNHWRDQINLHVNISLALKVFVDTDATLEIPTAEELAKYDIVITTYRYDNSFLNI